MRRLSPAGVWQQTSRRCTGEQQPCFTWLQPSKDSAAIAVCALLPTLAEGSCTSLLELGMRHGRQVNLCGTCVSLHPSL